MLPVLPILLVALVELRLEEELAGPCMTNMGTSPTAVSLHAPEAALIRQQTRWRTAPEVANRARGCIDSPAEAYDARTDEAAQNTGKLLLHGMRDTR